MLASRILPWLRSSDAPKAPALPPGIDLLSAAAHELRTPLTTLLAQAQDIERRLMEGRARTDPAAVHRIASEAQRLRFLIQELLEAAAIEKGLPLNELEPVDLAEQARLAAAARAPSLVVEAAAPVVGRYDRARMRLAIEAVLDNAVKYGDGSPIRMIVWRQRDEAYIAVQDRGSGIPDDDLPLVFERSHRGANARDRSVPGLGLGLYLARAIVRAHGGGLALHSTPFDGTTVTIALPCASSPVSEHTNAA